MMHRRKRELLAIRVTGLVLALLLVVAQVSVAAAALVATEAKIMASDAAAADLFGRVSGSVGVSGNTVVVGAYLDDDAGTSSGSAYIFQQDAGGWMEEAKLIASDAAVGDLFGQAVSIDGDVVLIGSFFDDDMGSHSGSAYVFRRSGGIWVEEAKLTASDGAVGDALGISVSLSGNVAVAGAPFIDDFVTKPGAAYVYRWNGSAWVEEAKLTASDGAAGDRFGDAVSVNGDVVVVGASFADVGSQADAGAAYIFRWNGSAWVEEAKLTANDAKREDAFGDAVSVSGDTVVVGAYLAGAGDRGQAYVYRWDGNTWSQEARLVPLRKARLFGQSVGIDGEQIIVGAPLGDDSEKFTGAAYIFQRSGTVWTEELKLTASDATKNDRYGESVCIHGNVAVVGAPQNDEAAENAGAAYIYDLTQT